MSRIRNTESELIKKFHDEWCVENGYKLQAASVKPEDLHAQNSIQFVEATSRKLQAPSPGSKLQASSRKRQAAR